MRTDIRPMGALSVSNEKLEEAYRSNAWIAEQKMDGSRYVAQVENGKIMLTSRRESVKGGMVDKTQNVPQIIKELSKFPDCILDGEIDNREVRDFHRVQGIMGSSPDKAIDRQRTDPLVYKVFDILSYQGKDLRYSALSHRKQVLAMIFSQHPELMYVKNTGYTSNESEKRTMFEKMIDAGQEGIILKNLNSLYVEDKKPSQTWYKVKLTQTYDGIVTGYKLGEGKYTGMLGTLTIAQYKDGVLTEVAEISGMTDSQRVEFKKRIDSGDSNWVVEFKAQEPEKNARYRHPRFLRIRTDKSPKQCVYGEA